MSLSLGQFAQRLVASGLMSRDELAAFQQSLPPERRPRTAEDLGKALVQSGKLTPYQASQVWQGMTKGLVFGEYVVLDKLGQGGMGVVYKARHQRMDRLVAIKMIRPDAMQSPDAVQRFYREVKAAARLSHPNIVTAYDAGEHEGMHYLVMEYVEGKDMARLLAEHGPLPVVQTLQCLIQAARGLEYAHQQGIVHRDIKPGNLLVQRSGTVKVSDMGLARMMLADAPQGVREEPLTGTAQVMGTFDYMAPEQALSSHQADGRADIYALGCTLYRLLTGELPYTGRTPVEILLAHQGVPIPSLCAKRPDVSLHLDAIFQKMLAKRPEDRYQSMGDVAQALAGYLVSGEQSTQLIDASQEATGSISSWLERLSRVGGAAVVAPPTAPPAASEETRLHHTDEETRRRKPVPVGSGISKKHYPLVIALSAVAGVLVLLLLMLALIPKGGPSDPVSRRRETSRQTTTALLPSRQAKPPRWQAAWEQAEAKAKALSAEERFGEAIQQYRSLPGLAEDSALRERVGETVVRLESLAVQARTEAEGRARQLLADKKYAEARSAIQPVVDRYGIAEHVEAAQKLLDEMKSAEAAAQPSPAKPPADRTSAPAKAPPRPEELAAQKELERQRQLAARYTEATRSAEALAAGWDFRGAAAELKNVRLEEEELSVRLSRRREELKRMHDLKLKLIAAINQANSPLKKGDLGIKGVGGDVTKADEEGFTATLADGKSETIPWSNIGPAGLSKLFARKQLDRLLSPAAADDWLAAGLVALTLGNASGAERCMAQARNLGMNIDPYLAPLGAAAFAEAVALLDKRQFSAADTLLTAIEEKYGSTSWFTSHAPALAAARAAAKSGARESEAEKLYSQAAELFDKKEFYDLKPLVQMLKARHADTRVATDQSRKPTFAEMEKAVATLGRRLSVSLEGKGKYRTIQAAVDAARIGDLVEIEDSGPYSESVTIAAEKSGITLQGKKGVWPVLLSTPLRPLQGPLIAVSAPNATVQRMLLLNSAPNERCNTCLANGAAHFRGVALLAVMDGNAVSNTGGLAFENCLILGDAMASYAAGLPPGVLFRNCFVRTFRVEGSRTEVRSCTIRTASRLLYGPTVFLDCVIGDLDLDIGSLRPGNLLEHCVTFGKVSPEIERGKGCVSANPLFRDPANLDYRPGPGSPCIGKASDGGDIGCRYTSEIIELCKQALELRRRGIIKF